jgi:exodeoxyribonuclease VII large subunit
MSPLKVLTRGYAMAQDAEGGVIRSVNQVAIGDTLQISLGDGKLTTAVTDIKENGL